MTKNENTRFILRVTVAHMVTYFGCGAVFSMILSPRGRPTRYTLSRFIYRPFCSRYGYAIRKKKCPDVPDLVDYTPP